MDTFEIFSSIFMFSCSVMGVICSLIFISGVIIVRCRCKPIIFIGLNSALAGLIVNIIYASQAVYQMLSDTSDILCEFRGFLLHCSTGLFYHTLCIQALYRLFVTVYAQRRSLQSIYIIRSIVVIQWIISATFAIPFLVMNRIKFQKNGRICQISIHDIFGFIYLSTFIYILPLLMTILIYIVILKYIKRNVLIVGSRQCVVGRKRRRRELQLIRRILILVFILFITGFPYVTLFFLMNINRLTLLSYGHRISFMFIAFGQGIVMLLPIIKSDFLRK